MWYNNHYLKGSIIWFTPPGNYAYHFINISFTFICTFLKIFGISSWYLSSHRSYLVFSVSFLFWMSHWGLCGFWSNNSPCYRFTCTRSQIFSLRVKYDIIQCCLFTVFKMIRDDRESVALLIKFMKDGVFFLSVPSMDFNIWGFKEPVVGYCSLHTLNQTLFFSNNHIISRIVHFFHNNFFLVFNLLLWGEICQAPLNMRPTYLLFRSKIKCNLPCIPETGG